MKQAQQKNGRREPWDDSGQAMVFVLMLLAVFLFGVAALGVDFANLWFHRQSAQTAADAACTAGAMDMLTDYNTGVASQGGFTPGTDFVCAGGSTIAPCQYAALNGYASGDTTPGSKVSVSFPTSAAVPGLDPSVIPPAAMASNAFIRVDVLEHVGTFLAGLLTGQRSLDVRSFAVCGVLLAQSPVPLLVLDPQGSSVSIAGSGRIAIVGGPSTSIQVNSNDNNAVDFSGSSARLDLSLGGPSGTGSNFGIFGGPRTTPSPQFVGGTTGHWQPQTPVGDPYAQLVAPAQPLYPGIKTPNVAYGFHGCPDPTGCDEYSAGYYGPPGITVKNKTAIFQEGIYYVVGGMSLQANSMVRPSTEPASAAHPSDQIGGTMFYFSGTGTLSVAANSGSNAADAFNTTTGSGVYSFGAKCTAASQIPMNLPASLTGSVLLAPCTGPSRTPCSTFSTCYGDPSGTGGPLGEQRGMLFFQDRSASANPDWQGGGQSLLAGSLYFHHCNASGTGISCGSPTTYYNDVLHMGGNPGAGTYILGNTIADNLDMNGTPDIAMVLNPTASFAILKATLLR